MKHFKFIFALFAILLAGIPMLGSAAQYSPGTVTVNGDTMTGYFNVRFNNSVPYGQVGISGGEPNQSIVIYGTDSSSGNFFLCIMARTNPSFDSAEKLLYGSVDGKLIYVSKGDSSLCSNLSVNSDSEYMH